MPIFDSISNFLLEVMYQLQVSPNPFYSAVILFINGLWVPMLIITLAALKTMWIDWRQTLFHINRRHFIILAIDVPRDNEQSPKAVENIFSNLYGIILSRNNLYQQWWEGRHQDYFSMELVSIEGYVQFLVYTMEEYRDIVESAFYSQYPDAEITQVEDYVYGQNREFKNMKWPNKTHDIFGTEYVLAKPNAYSLRLWRDFEHALSQEFKDPMASLLENMNKIGPGEQIWLQWVITPAYDADWQGPSQKLAMKIAGKKAKVSESFLDQLIGSLVSFLDGIGTAIFPFYNYTEENAKVKDDMPSMMLHLTPTESAQLEGIQMKADKPGFWTKMRFVYIAEKNAASKPRGVNPIIGSLRQYDSANQNSFKMHKWTKTSGIYYWMVKQRMGRRKTNILKAFQNRSRSMGSNGMILNTEELATLYHFPTEVVKAPLVSRTQSKRAAAPISLPVGGAPRTLREPVKEEPQEIEKKIIDKATKDATKDAPSARSNQAPGNLPFI